VKIKRIDTRILTEYMRCSIQRLPILLRASLLGLLMLAVVGKPMTSSMCVTHQLGHTLSASGHGHFHHDSGAERQMDSDHANGAHDLLHGGDHGTYADIAAVITLPVVRFESDVILLPTELPAPLKHVARPFRPPIA
jgi:hypothetical protein